MKQIAYVLAIFLGAVGWPLAVSAQSPVDPEEPLSVRGPASVDQDNSSDDQSGQEPPTAPIVGPTIIVTKPQFLSLTPPFGLLGRSETTIATDPNGTFVVEGWNFANGFIDSTQSLSGFGFSVDGGKTFTDGGSLPFGTFGGLPVVPLGDPWLAVLDPGNLTFLYSSLGLRPDLATEVGITVHRGAIGNKILRWAAPAIITPPGANDMLDKEALAVDPRENGNGKTVYVSTTNFLGVGGSQIEVYRSLNSGATFTGPTIVKTPDSAGQQGSQVVVGPNGQVYVVWERGRFTSTPQILFRASTDRGATFGPLTTVANITGLTSFPPVGYNRSRYNDFPRMAVDLASSHRGRIYVAYQDAGSNPNVHTDGVFFNPTNGATIPTGGVRDGDIYLKFSDNQGTTWSAPSLVSSPSPGDGLVQFWPVVSVEPDGSVDVFYHQDREALSNPVNPLATNIRIDARFPGFTRRQSSYQSIVDVYAAHSTNGGVTFGTPVRVNDAPSNWSIAATNIRPNFGDYISSASGGSKLYCTWAQSHLYDIDPGPGVNNRFVPSAAFAMVNFSGSNAQAVATAPARQIPGAYALSQNYPNPFNPVTVVMYDLPQGRDVSLRVYDALGRQVATLVEGFRDAGHHVALFDGRNLASGAYYYKLQAGDFHGTGRMMLLK